MPFDYDSLTNGVSQARERGFTDEQIYDHLSKSNAGFQQARESGYKLNDVLSHLGSKQTNGGEQNEVNKQSQPEANSYSDEQRQANEQVKSSVEAGLQSNEVQLREPQGQEQPVGNEQSIGQDQQTLITGGNSSAEENQTPSGVQGQKAGQGLRSQVPPRNQAQVNEEANVPSVASNIVGTLTSPFGYVGEEGWKAIAGIARTVGSESTADFATQASAQSVEDWAKTFGGTPQKEGVGKTIGQVGAFALEAPLIAANLGEGAAMAAVGKAGMGLFLAQGYGAMKEGLFDKYKQEGMSEEDANSKSTTHAALNTIAALPAYILGGQVAGKAADAFIAKSSPALLQLAGRVGMNGVANMVASAAARGFGAALEGENIVDAAKEFSLAGVLQDFAFAGHSTGEWFKNSINKAQAARSLTDENLTILSNSKQGDNREVALAEMNRRESEKQAVEAEEVGLTETAKVVEVPAPSEAEAAQAKETTALNQKAIEAGIPEDVVEGFVVSSRESGLNDEQISQRIEEYKKLNDEIDALKPKPEVEAVQETEIKEVAPEPAKEPAPTEGERIYSAAYKNPETGEILEGVNHEAIGKENGIEIPAKESEREGPEYGFITIDENGNKTFRSRETAQTIGEKNGQFIGKRGESPVARSKEFRLDKYNEAIHLADSIHNGDIFRYEGSDLKLLSLQDDGVLARDLKTKQEILLPKGTDEGNPSGIEGLSLVRKGKRKNAPLGAKERNILKKQIRSRLKGEGGFLDVTPIYDFAREIYKSGMDFATFARKMVAELGSKVKEVLQKVYEAISQGPTIAGKRIKGKTTAGSIGGVADEFGGGEKLKKAPVVADDENIPFNIDGEMVEPQALTSALKPTEPAKPAKAPEAKTINSPEVTIIPEPQGTGQYKTDILATIESSLPAGKTKNSLKAVVEGTADPKTPKEQSLYQKALKKLDLFQTDLKAMGVKTPSDKPNKNLFSGLKDAYHMVADMLEGTTIPELTKAGSKLTATQHAQARRMMQPYVEHLIAEIFPDMYSDNADRTKIGPRVRSSSQLREMVMDIINKDNILGGVDAILDEISIKERAISEIRDEITAAKEDGVLPARNSATKILALEEEISNLRDSLSDIKEVHNLEKYASEVEAAKGTVIEDYINNWKEKIHPLIDELNSKINDSDRAPQDQAGRVFGARINLLSENQAVRLEGFSDDSKATPRVKVVNYRNPDVRSFRTDRPAQYNQNFSKNVESILMSSFAPRINEATKIDLYNDLIKNGNAIKTSLGGTAPEIAGKPARLLEVEMPMTDKESGKTKLKNVALWVKADVYDELIQILEVNTPRDQAANPIANAITQFQLIGIADATSHLKNLHAVVTNALGRGSIKEDILSKIPIYGTVKSVMDIRKVVSEIIADTPEIRKEKADIARASGSRPYFEAEGVQKYLPLHKLLHDTDMAARIIMNRRYTELVKRGFAENSEEGRIDFVNQIGEYNKRLMTSLEARLKTSGFSPFIVAGRAMNRNARRLITGVSGYKSASTEAELAARGIQMTGLVMAATMPAIVNMMTTGSMFGREGTPIGAIDFGPNFDTSDGKHRTFDLLQMVGIRRGLRQLGLNAAIEGLKNGDSWDNIQKNALNDAFTTSMHPFIGPAAGMLVETATGKRLDLRSGYSDMFTSRKVGGSLQYVENFRTALKQQNELLYNVTPLGYGIEKGMEAAGIPRPAEQTQIETLRDIGFPQDIPAVSSVGKALYTAAGTAVAAAGGKLASTPALKLSAQLGSKQQYDPIQDLRYDARKKILEAYKNGETQKAQDLFQQGFSDGILTQSDIKVVKGKLKEPDLLFQRVSRLKTAQDAVSVFRVATAEEQDKIAPVVWKKINGSQSITRDQYNKLKNEFLKTAKPTTQVAKGIKQNGNS